jgi:hypothetical protein
VFTQDFRKDKGLTNITGHSDSIRRLLLSHCLTLTNGSGGGDSTHIRKQGSINGVPCEILLDTGINQSLVHSDLITEEDIIDQYTTIRCMHGDKVSYPLAVIKVGIGE